MPRPIITEFFVSDPSSAKTNLSGGCISPRAKNTYSTVIRSAVWVMVMLDPQPLPISPMRSPPALRCPSPAGDGSLVQRPEKSGLVWAVVPTAKRATSAILKRFVRRFINLVSFGPMTVNYGNRVNIRRHSSVESKREDEMKRKAISQLFGCFLGLGLLLPLTARAQNAPQKSGNLELERVQAMIRQARQESEQFLGSGGKASDANHPNLKWAATLWQYRGEHPSAPATDLATSEALRLLIRADHINEMQAKADTLKPDDAAWKQAINALMEAATNRGDYDYLISKAQALIQHATEPEIKLRARFTLGRAYWKKGDTEQAKAAFQAVITQHPNTSYAEAAEGNLMEMQNLNLGQPAPLFADRTINGEPISLADFKGKVVVLKFWASW